MQIKIWGCRGSLPTPGVDTLIFGGNTTCVQVTLDSGHIIIIDAGSGIRPLGLELIKHLPPKVCLFLTHAHWDHLMGFPFFNPIYIKDFNLKISGHSETQESIQTYLSHQMKAPFFPVEYNTIQSNITIGCHHNKKCQCDDVVIESINLNHPNGCLGYKFTEKNKSFVFFSDHEIEGEHPNSKNNLDYVKFAYNCDLLLHDAQYTTEEYLNKKQWGHSTYEQAINFAYESKAKKLGFIHHDPERSDLQLVELEKLASVRCEKKGAMCCKMIREGDVFEL